MEVTPCIIVKKKNSEMPRNNFKMKMDIDLKEVSIVKLCQVDKGIQYKYYHGLNNCILELNETT